MKVTSGHELYSFDEFYGLLFPDKGFGSAKARKSNHKNSNARDNVVVRIGSRFIFYYLEG